MEGGGLGLRTGEGECDSLSELEPDEEDDAERLRLELDFFEGFFSILLGAEGFFEEDSLLSLFDVGLFFEATFDCS